MTLKDFEKKINDLNDEIRDKISDNENEIFPIFDGPLSVKEYFNSPIKIMWLMKEAYGDDFDFTDIIEKNYEGFLNDFINGKSRTTWHPVVYTTYGILNNLEWKIIPDIKDDSEIVKCLKNVAWVNIQKLPSSTGTTTNMNNINIAFEKYQTIIKNQIELLNPDIIICGGIYRTPGLLEKIFDTSIVDKIEDSWVEYNNSSNFLILSAYHPSCRRKKEKYVNDINDVVKKIYNKQK